MTIEIKAPTLPESVPDGTIANWYKNVGDTVSRDELLVDIETDKVVIEVVSPTDGTLKEILKEAGDTIVSNQAIGSVLAGEGKQESAAPKTESSDVAVSPAPQAETVSSEAEAIVSPAARKLIEENNLDGSSIKGSGKDGRITKEDVLKSLESGATHAAAAGGSAPQANIAISEEGRLEERVPMSRLRAKVAERLLQASQSTAMLTTFNEVNMQPVMEIRNRYKEE